LNYKETITVICRRYAIADLYVFGSRSAEIAARVWENQGPAATHVDSDVDIGAMPLNVSKFGPLQRASMTIELEDLFYDAPRIDLVVLAEADPFLSLEIIRGELLYTNDPDRQARHELYILRRAGDLMPYKKERMRMIMEEGAT
jgi:hypothetical protein